MQEEIKRNSDGTYSSGQSGNSAGGNGNVKGFQKAGPRIRHFLEKPAAEVMELTKDPDAMLKLPMRDYLILTRMVAATKNSTEGRKNMQELFDRAYGKATQILGNDIENPFIAPLPDKFISVEEAMAVYLAETKARPM